MKPSYSLGGSPTQVHKVNYVVLEGAESKEITPTPEGIRALIEELVKECIVARSKGHD